MPTLVFVVPSYNAERFLATTLASLAAQTDMRWRCIVVDDGSSDSTAAIATTFAQQDQRFELVKQDNSGVAAARNRGALNLRKDYITFLDADDVLDPRFVEIMLDAVKHPGAIAAYSNASYIDADGLPFDVGVVETWTRLRAGSDGHRLRRVPAKRMINGPTLITPGQMVVSADAHHGIGGFEGRLRLIEDWDYQIRLAEAGLVLFVDETLLSYRRHGGNNSVKHSDVSRKGGQVVRLRSVARATPGRERRGVLRLHQAFYWDALKSQVADRMYGRAAQDAALILAYSPPLWRGFRWAVQRWVGPPASDCL